MKAKQAILPLHAEAQEQEAVSTLVPELEKIRAYVAANGRGMTRDEVILEELTKLLHAKVHDETSNQVDGGRKFIAIDGEPPASLRRRVNGLLEGAAESKHGGTEWSPIEFDDACLEYAVKVLQDRKLRGAERDVIGEAYQSLIFPSLRGGQGQFFTPKNVAECLAAILDVPNQAHVIDPACGTGGFLLEVAGHARTQNRSVHLHGVDKDSLLARLAADSLNLLAGDARVVCANSLTPPNELDTETSGVLTPGYYDAVITNPPFGAKIPVTGERLLAQYDLARKWNMDKRTGKWVQSTTIKDSVPPQILFIELCYRLLKNGGTCGIVLPEGVLGNQGTGYIRQWLIERSDILAVIDCPLETFMPSTSTKTVILVFQKTEAPERPDVLMAVPEKCGHDRRGNPLSRAGGEVDDDFPAVVEAWEKHRIGRDA